MSYLAQAQAVEVPEVEYKSSIVNSEENLRKLDEALTRRFGEKGLKLNKTVIERGGKLPDGSNRVPFAVVTKSKPGGSLTVWVDRNDPSVLNVVWSGVISSKLLEDAGIEKL